VESTNGRACQGRIFGKCAAIQPVRDAVGGSIVNVSSIFGVICSPSSTAYHAAKGANRTFTKAAAVEYAPERIRVNALHPGFAQTPLTTEMFDKPQVKDWVLQRIPMGRIGTADDLVPGMVFLSADKSRYMTGSELVSGGGVTAQ